MATGGPRRERSRAGDGEALQRRLGVLAERARRHEPQQTSDEQVLGAAATLAATAYALMDLSRARLAGQATDTLLHTILRSVRSVLGAHAAAIALINPDAPGSPAVRAIDHDEQCRHPMPLVMEGDDDPAVVQLPIVTTQGHIGTLAVIRCPDASPFDDVGEVVAAAFAREAALTLQLGEIGAELDRLALLEERERIAMDLHDGVVQALFVVGLSLQDAESVTGDPDEIRVRLGHAVDSIDSTIRHLRDYIFGLRPTEYADRYLSRALNDLADMAERSGRVTVTVEIDPRAASALATRTATVVQAAREAISNAIQHSGGDKVALRFVTVDGCVLLEVCDNGHGFALDGAHGQGHGLSNLSTRAADLGGTLEVDTAPEHGTRVRIRVPL